MQFSYPRMLLLYMHTALCNLKSGQYMKQFYTSLIWQTSLLLNFNCTQQTLRSVVNTQLKEEEKINILNIWLKKKWGKHKKVWGICQNVWKEPRCSRGNGNKNRKWFWNWLWTIVADQQIYLPLNTAHECLKRGKRGLRRITLLFDNVFV